MIGQTETANGAVFQKGEDAASVSGGDPIKVNVTIVFMLVCVSECLYLNVRACWRVYARAC